ncbi:hypothetical protein ACH5RR_009223 [Cinchona calisaya]|uniref:Uncharacterized protein n=1 Tax=Cinchona calisaya TaxID=153742 RepID=A0ABD3AG06_9GENT
MGRELIRVQKRKLKLDTQHDCITSAAGCIPNTCNIIISDILRHAFGVNYDQIQSISSMIKSLHPGKSDQRQKINFLGFTSLRSICCIFCQCPEKKEQRTFFSNQDHQKEKVKGKWKDEVFEHEATDGSPEANPEDVKKNQSSWIQFIKILVAKREIIVVELAVLRFQLALPSISARLVHCPSLTVGTSYGGNIIVKDGGDLMHQAFTRLISPLPLSFNTFYLV